MIHYSIFYKKLKKVLNWTLKKIDYLNCRNDLKSLQKLDIKNV